MQQQGLLCRKINVNSSTCMAVTKYNVRVAFCSIKRGSWQTQNFLTLYDVFPIVPKSWNILLKGWKKGKRVRDEKAGV
jgi:hypothetical protein